MLSLSVAFAVATLTAGAFATLLVEADCDVVVLDDSCDDAAVLVSLEVDELSALSVFAAAAEVNAFDALELLADAVCDAAAFVAALEAALFVAATT